MSAAGVGTVMAVVSAVVWALAAAGKVARHRDTVTAFAGLGLPGAGVLAVAVPAAELAVAAALLVRPEAGGAAGAVEAGGAGGDRKSLSRLNDPSRSSHVTSFTPVSDSESA